MTSDVAALPGDVDQQFSFEKFSFLFWFMVINIFCNFLLKKWIDRTLDENL